MNRLDLVSITKIWPFEFHFLGEFDLAQSEAIEIDVIVEKDEENPDQPKFVQNYLKKYKSESEAVDPTKNIVFKLYNPKSQTFENLPTSDRQMIKKIARIDFLFPIKNLYQAFLYKSEIYEEV